MSRKAAASHGERDLDQRPLGDSFFGEPRRNPRAVRRDRLSRRAHTAPEPSQALDPSSRYAWHEGFFEDAEPARTRNAPDHGRPASG